MKLRELAGRLGWESLTPELMDEVDVDVTCGHVSDVLSDVLTRALKGSVLITIQTHMNVVATALHGHLAAVVFAAGRIPGAKVCWKAVDERIPLFVSKESAFDTTGKLHALGLRGTQG